MSKNSSMDFLSHSGGDFAPYSDADDLLHTAENAKVSDDSLAETQYFGFKIPSAEINGLGYLWVHPNLSVVTGGAMVWQGIKPHTLAADIFDMRAFMNASLLQQDLREYKLPNGYEVRCITPMQRHRITYSDSFRKNAFEIELDAVMPPAMYNPRGHFEQTMRTKGMLTLKGKTFDVDFFAVRDRSWGKPRPEDIALSPPVAWMNGVFDATFAFCVSALDHPDMDPEWKGAYELAENQVLKGGWVSKAGKMLPIKSVKKRTTRNPRTLFPETIDMVFIDSEQNEYRMKGKILAACHWSAWPNLSFPMAMVHWECNGQSGYGDVQEAQWADYVKRFMKFS